MKVTGLTLEAYVKKHHNGSVLEAADALGVSFKTVYNNLETGAVVINGELFKSDRLIQRYKVRVNALQQVLSMLSAEGIDPLDKEAAEKSIKQCVAAKLCLDVYREYIERESV